MDLNSNIILQGQRFENPMDMAMKALSMRQMLAQNQQLEKTNSERDSLDELMKANTTKDESGKMSVNYPMVVEQMMKINPSKALELEKQYKGKSIDDMKADTEAKQNLLIDATPENFAMKKQLAIKMGLLNADNLPDQVTPEIIAQIQARTLDISKQFDMKNKERDFKHKEREFGQKSEELGLKRLERQDARELKASDKLQKKHVLMNEIEDRRFNINGALDSLNKMIADNGTFETFGPHNKNLDRLISQIATDMAKLQDPNSVARPSEVDEVKKHLVDSGFENTNYTAAEVLKTFRAEVARRADSAYDIRGLKKPINLEKTPDKIVDTGASLDELQAELLRRKKP